MRTFALLLLTLACTAGAKTSSPSLQDAAAARGMLGGAVWSRIVRIENSRPAGFTSKGAYPRVVYAVVFEMSGILWFYTDTDGTQSISTTRGTLARDEANPGPLLMAVDPGFTSWSWVVEADVPRAPASLRPPNSCFEESVAALFRRASVGEEASAPRLLFYYVSTPHGMLGHTVLVFGTSSGLAAIDSEISDRPVRLPPELGSDPRALSGYLRGGPVSAARTLPVSCEGRGPDPSRWASGKATPQTAG